MARNLPPAPPILTKEVAAPAIPDHMDFPGAMLSVRDHRVALAKANRRIHAFKTWYEYVKEQYAGATK